MSLARLVVTAVRIEGPDKADVSRDYWVSPRWVYELCRRFDAEGEAQHGLPIYWAIGLGLSRATISGVSSVGLSSARSGSVQGGASSAHEGLSSPCIAARRKDPTMKLLKIAPVERCLPFCPC